ncbi:MAG: ribbon-helix-helix protein, CopG family, partial [Acidimicrobiales bacterium]|nr:ribbon-helix-helix protein, CopG family [Acidimicrobiales bacterium]
VQRFNPAGGSGHCMRTTVTLDDDVAKALERLRREHGLGTSAAFNELVRPGLAAGEPPMTRFRQRTSSMGAPKVALDDIGAVLELLEGEGHG